MKIPVSGNFYRYFLASLFALGVDSSIFSFAVRVLGVSWFWAAPIGFFFGAVIAYALSVKWVFSARALPDQPAIEFAIFIVVGIAGLVLTEIVLAVAVGQFHLAPEPGKMIAAVCTFLFNYVARKAILFSNSLFGFFQRNEMVR